MSSSRAARTEISGRGGERGCGSGEEALISNPLVGEKQGRQPRAEMRRERGHLAGELGQAGTALDRHLVHIEGAVDLDLQSVKARRRLAVMPGGEAARIRVVAHDLEALLGEDRLHKLGERRRAGGAVAISE